MISTSLRTTTGILHVGGRLAFAGIQMVTRKTDTASSGCFVQYRWPDARGLRTALWILRSMRQPWFIFKKGGLFVTELPRDTICDGK